VRSLRRALHDLRAHSVARYLGGEEQWRAPAVRAGQARPLARYRLPQAADRSRKASKSSSSGIQRQIETSGESEIPAQAIGELVMEGLKGLDSVAYIRFASVYKDFREAKDFEDFASAVKEAGGD
jgi:transcriptional regulator NrdR family protein